MKLQHHPFRHVVIDGFADASRLDRIIACWPHELTHKTSTYSVKSHVSDWMKIPPAALSLIDELNSPVWCERIRQLLDLDFQLHPDPSLEGGGLHHIDPGGYLKIHVDFNWHKKLEMRRRVNLLLYLNRGWEREWGGSLELWDDVGKVVEIEPLFNRCVIFETSETSWHGHPHPLRSPEPRRSLALYYYTHEPVDRPRTKTVYRC